MSRSRETEYGKGDDDRTEDHGKYREGFEKIDWRDLGAMTPEEIVRKVREACAEKKEEISHADSLQALKEAEYKIQDRP